MTARILDISLADYHSDIGSEKPRLSSSTAKLLIDASPLHAWQFHPRLGKLQRERTDALDNGSLIHALVLGKGEEKIAVLDFPDFKTKAAREARDAAREAGKVVVKASDYEAARETADILKERMAGYKDNYFPNGIVFDGESEVKVEWSEETTKGRAPVLCRGMIDHLTRNGYGPLILELKTIRSASLKAISRDSNEYGYDLQETSYRSAVEHLRPELVGRVDVVFLFCETEPPFAVTPVRQDGYFREMGEQKWKRACRVWGRCLRTDVWPAYVTRIATVEPPAWAMNDVPMGEEDDDA